MPYCTFALNSFSLRPVGLIDLWISAILTDFLPVIFWTVFLFIGFSSRTPSTHVLVRYCPSSKLCVFVCLYSSLSQCSLLGSFIIKRFQFFYLSAVSYRSYNSVFFKIQYIFKFRCFVFHLQRFHWDLLNILDLLSPYYVPLLL